MQGRRAQAEALSAYFFSSAVYSKLPQLSNKVMYLHGAVDVLLPVKGVYMAAARTPAADVIVLDGQGHGGVYQAPLQLSRCVGRASRMAVQQVVYSLQQACLCVDNDVIVVKSLQITDAYCCSHDAASQMLRYTCCCTVHIIMSCRS